MRAAVASLALRTLVMPWATPPREPGVPPPRGTSKRIKENCQPLSQMSLYGLKGQNNDIRPDSFLLAPAVQYCLSCLK